MNTYIYPILIILILIIINGIFVAAEFAIVSVPETSLRKKTAEGSLIAKNILLIVANQNLQNRYITTAQVGITIASLSLGMYGEHTIASWLLPLFEKITFINTIVVHSLATFGSVTILTYFHVVLGEMIPKSLALQSPEKTMNFLYSPMNVYQKIFSVIVNFLNFISNIIIKSLGVPEIDKSERLYSSAELEYTVDESFSGGYFDSGEKIFLENIFDLVERTVEHAMTPRNHIIAFSNQLSKNELLENICKNTKTRYPIYMGESIDQIIGILHIKDFARSLVSTSEEWDIGKLIRPVVFVPESLPLNDLLIKFKHISHQQIAIVFGEFGDVTGVISMEDLLEEVVGEIQDEFDDEISPIKKISEGLYRIQGEVILDEINQQLNLNWKHEEAITIAGLIIATIGNIPKRGQKIQFQGAEIVVEKILDNEIESITLLIK
jgi:CBS domain containing-hemolysin-like protein